MKSVIKKIKDHKILSAVMGICLVGVIGVGTGFGIHQAKVANTQKALLMAQDGYIDSDELNQLGDDIVLGEEIVAPDGSTVVITKDDSGNFVTTKVEYSSGSVVSPVAGHTHSWVAHYATRQVPQTQEVYHPAITHIVPHDYCSECNGIADSGPHTHNGHLSSTHTGRETVVDQEAWTETVTTYITEQYVDYYYCSECGTLE